ncbi:PAS domain S-box protein [Candidatus Peregrinibacteria bacterium]|nr:PAS domain S-box protein [Candidatus Peregrinibacteria bacterium]
MSSVGLNKLLGKRYVSTADDILKDVNAANLVKTMNECLWVGDKNHKTVYVNPLFEKTSGYSLEEAIGKDCVFFFDEEGKKIIQKHHEMRSLGKSSQYEANMTSKDGKIIPLLISGTPAKSGGTMGIFTNLTRLKRLSRQEKMTRQILKFSTEAIVILDQNREITLWSNGARQIFGYAEDEILNKNIGLVIPEEEIESNKKLLDDVWEKGHIQNIETRRQTKSGEVIDVLVSVTKVLDEKDHLIGYLVIYRDITQQKRISTELQKRFETIQDAYKELGLQRRHLDYLYEIVDCAIDPNSSLANLEKLIVSALCLLTKCDGAVLRTYDEQKKLLKLSSCFGVSQKWLNKNQIKFENSLAQEAFANKRPIIVDDIDTNPKHQGLKLLKSHNFKAMVLIALAINKKILGSISLYATDASKFRMIETDFLEKVGCQCAISLFAKKYSIR